MRSTDKGYSLVDFLLALSVGTAFVLFSVSNSSSRNIATHLDIAKNNIETVLQALDKHYYSYCRDPSSAPTLTIAELINKRHLSSAQIAFTHFSESAMAPSVSWSPPAYIQVSVPAGSSEVAALLAEHLGTATASGSDVIVRRSPRAFQHAMNSERATFSKLFESGSCRI